MAVPAKQLMHGAAGLALAAGARAWTVGRTVDIAAGSARGRAEK